MPLPSLPHHQRSPCPSGSENLHTPWIRFSTAGHLEDIIEITCLILEEGGECRYVHKSIQEYHAACYVKERPEPQAKTFYDKMHTEWERWEQVLVFLEQIDKYHFEKWFAIPDRRKLLALAQGDPLPENALSATALDACYGAYYGELDLMVRPEAGYRFAAGGYPKTWALRNQMKPLIGRILQVLDIHAGQIEVAMRDGKLRCSQGSFRGLVKISFAEMMSIPAVQKDLREVFRPVYEREVQCLKDSCRYIDQAEDSEVLREL